MNRLPLGGFATRFLPAYPLSAGLPGAGRPALLRPGVAAPLRHRQGAGRGAHYFH